MRDTRSNRHDFCFLRVAEQSLSYSDANCVRIRKGLFR